MVQNKEEQLHKLWDGKKGPVAGPQDQDCVRWERKARERPYQIDPLDCFRMKVFILQVIGRENLVYLTNIAVELI